MLVLDSLPVGDFAFVHAQGETAVRIGAGPSFENYRRSILPVIGQWDENPIVALLAFRQVHLHSSFHAQQTTSSQPTIKSNGLKR